MSLHKPADSELLIPSDKKIEALEKQARDLARSIETVRQQPLARSNERIETLEQKPHEAKLFDSAIVGNAQEAVDFITNILESSTEYSVIGEDLTGKILLWNEGARRLYGYEPEEAVGKANSSILHVAEDIRSGKHKEIMAAALRDGKWEGTLLQARKSGQCFTARVVITPRRDSASKAMGYLLISKDISAEIGLMEELKDTQFYARSLIEAALDPQVTISPAGKIMDVNEATVNVTGIARDKLIGTDFSDYFTEPAKAREGYQQVFSQGFVTDYPLTIRHRDGRLTDVLYNASVYKDTRGNVLGVFAAARDVTAQKQAALYARSLIEASLDPLVTLSPEGKITDVNEATVKGTGLPRDQLIGTDFCDYFTEPAKAREGYQQVFSRGFVTDYPLTIRHKNGRLIDVLYNASVLKDTQGKVLGVFAVARDVTAQKRAEAEVSVQRNRELERLAELERFQKLTVGRELKMIELKKEIEDSKKRLAQYEGPSPCPCPSSTMVVGNPPRPSVY
jgi:PAS domain S-box-containing protein